MKEKLTLTEVSVLIGSSPQTINYWYRFKKKHPNNEYAQLLPNFTQEGNRQTRYWRECDIYKLVEFKNTIPKGRNGILGDITQKYYRNRKDN